MTPTCPRWTFAPAFSIQPNRHGAFRNSPERSGVGKSGSFLPIPSSLSGLHYQDLSIRSRPTVVLAIAREPYRVPLDTFSSMPRIKGLLRRNTHMAQDFTLIVNSSPQKASSAIATSFCKCSFVGSYNVNDLAMLFAHAKPVDLL